MVFEVAAGLLGRHGGHGVAQPDPLIEGGEDAEFHPSSQGGLADEQAGERARGVHVVVGEHADRLELGVVEQVGLVEDQDGGAAACVLFDRQRVDGLRDQGGVVGQRAVPEGGNDLVVDAPDSDCGSRCGRGPRRDRVRPTARVRFWCGRGAPATPRNS